MQVLHFFTNDPRTNTPVGMEIWLGGIGPLNVGGVMPPPTSVPGAVGIYGQPLNGYGGPPGLDAEFIRNGSGNGAGPSGEQTILPSPDGTGTGNGSEAPLPGTGRHTSLDPPGTRRTTDPVMVISVEMPPITHILEQLRAINGEGGAESGSGSGTSTPSQNPATQLFSASGQPQPSSSSGPQQQMQQLRAMTLPIIFVRPYDLVGYMTGYSIAVENVFGMHGAINGMNVQGLGEGLGGTQGWTLRVV